MSWMLASQLKQDAQKRAAEQQAQAIKQAQQSNMATPQPATPQRSSPMPPDVGTPSYVVQGSYVQKGATIIDDQGKTLGVVGTPSQPVLEANKSYGVIAPTPPTPPPQMVEPSLPNIIANPVGVAGTTAYLASQAANALSKSPDTSQAVIGRIASFESGAFGELANQGTQVQNFFSQKQNTLPFTPLNEEQRLGQSFFRVGEAVEIAAVAPIVAPVIGVSAVGVIGGELVSVGVEQGFKAIQGGGVLTIEEATQAAAFGGVFSVAGGTVFKGIGLAGRTLGVGLPSGARGTAASVLGRASVNAGMSGGISYVASGGDTEATLKGAAFGALFSFGMEPIGRFTNRFHLEERLTGVKATQLTGAKEIEVQREYGGKIYTERITNPITSEVKLSYKEAQAYSELLRYSRSPRVNLAGTETVIQKGGGEYNVLTGPRGTMDLAELTIKSPNRLGVGGEIIEGFKGTEYAAPKPVETSRSATPLIEAVKGNPYKLAETRLGKASDFIKTPSETYAVQETKVTVGTQNKGRTPAVMAEKVVSPQEKIIVPESQVTMRRFTGVQLSAKVDPQVFAKVAKALPQEYADEIYTKLGGQSRMMIQRGIQPRQLRGGMKPFGGSVGSSKVEVKASTDNLAKQVEVNKEITAKFDKAIVNVDLKAKGNAWMPPGSAVNVWGRQRQTNATEVEEQIIAYPKNSVLQTPRAISIQERRQASGEKANIIVSNAVDTSASSKQNEALINISEQVQRQNQSTDTVVKLVVKETTVLTYMPSMRLRETKTPNALFALPSGGGAGGGGSKGEVGLWGKRKHAIPSPKQLTKQVLGGKASLKVRSLAATESKLYGKAKRKRRKR